MGWADLFSRHGSQELVRFMAERISFQPFSLKPSQGWPIHIFLGLHMQLCHYICGFDVLRTVSFFNSESQERTQAISDLHSEIDSTFENGHHDNSWYIYMYMYVNIYTDIYFKKNICLFMFIHIYIYMFLYAYIYIYICLYEYAVANAYVIIMGGYLRIHKTNTWWLWFKYAPTHRRWQASLVLFFQ